MPANACKNENTLDHCMNDSVDNKHRLPKKIVFFSRKCSLVSSNLEI